MSSETRQPAKNELREIFRARFASDSVTPQQTEALNTRIVEFISTRVGCWAGYQPIHFEADPRSAMKNLSACDWVFPRVEGESLAFYRGDSTIANRWGILEPDPARCERIDLQELDGLLIPGLAFDFQCNRLGRGAGFYDRALAEILITNPDVIKAGVALERQISQDEFPVESFDVPMNWVLTEQRTLSRSSETRVKGPKND